MSKYFYKQMGDNLEIESILSYEYYPNITNPRIIEITEKEYNALLAEIQAANNPDPDEISDTEALNIILGVSE